jgi:hypothetical protein
MFNTGLKIVLVLLVMMSVCGCTQTPVISDNKQQSASNIANGNSWWYYRVKVNRPDKAPPNWAMGALVAGEIFSPVLQRYRQDIKLWRFHRRAGSDKAGHQFSFIFYSSALTAQSIYDDLADDELLLELLQEGKLDSVQLDNTGQLSKPDIEDTSDKSWPLIIQKSWPDYIMGVSQMWLNLVQRLAEKHNHDDVIHRYDLVQKELTRLWVQHGQHVWLHHLNALYAYEPFFVRY